jgi:ABC-type oligopeptide transport system substrate-binding subunit
MTNQVSRRKFLRTAALAGAGAVLAGCGEAVKETVVVEKEKLVTQVVKETVVVEGEAKEVTKIVEVEVTPTPVPAEVTVHGRELPADAAPYDQQIWIESQGENKHLDVARDIYSANSVLNKSVEPMLRRDQNQDIVPAVAESWSVGPNAEYFDFVIRKDCKWSDGTPLTAHDWVYTFRHIAHPELDTPWAYFWYPIKNIKEFKAGEVTAEEVGAEALDDQTLRIYANGAQIPALLAYQASVPVPKHLAESNPSHWADSADTFVGNGPWRLVEWTHNVRMWHEPNEYYNGPHKPAFKEICGYIGMSDPWTSWKSYELPLASLGQTELREVRNDPKLNSMLHFFNNFQSGFLICHTQRPPLDNTKLRQALSHAIDRETMCYTVLGGTASPGYTMLPPGFPAFNQEGLKHYQAFDVELAKSLLAEAGYPEGKDATGKQLEVRIDLNGRNAQAEFIQQQWQDNLGIKVNLDIMDGGVWSKRRAEHDLEMFFSGYEYDYIDPANFLTQGWRSISEKGSNRCPWLNEEFDALCDLADKEPDPEKRLDHYRAAEEILVSEAAGIFLTHGIIYQIWHDFVTGVPADKDGNVVWRYLDLTLMQAYYRNDVTDFVKLPTR